MVLICVHRRLSVVPCPALSYSLPLIRRPVPSAAEGSTPTHANVGNHEGHEEHEVNRELRTGNQELTTAFLTANHAKYAKKDLLRQRPQRKGHSGRHFRLYRQAASLYNQPRIALAGPQPSHEDREAMQVAVLRLRMPSSSSSRCGIRRLKIESSIG